MIAVSYFSSIDTELKAYILGTIASDSHKKFSYSPVGDIATPVRNTIESYVHLSVNPNDFAKIFRTIFDHLGIGSDPMNSCKDMIFPRDIRPDLEWTFIRGLFDGLSGKINAGSGRRECFIALPASMKYSVLKIVKGLKSYVDESEIVFVGTNSIDFLSKIYDNVDPKLRNSDKYNSYLNFLGWGPDFRGMYGKIPTCKFTKSHPDAVVPSKLRASDEGMDLVIIAVNKIISEVTTRYDTGIRVQPEQGWHVELLPRSSLSNSGYMLANSIGLIDESYSGNLLVALTKVNPNAPPIQLPFKAVQMILRRSIHFICEEVKDLEETSRGESCFGSTG